MGNLEGYGGGGGGHVDKHVVSCRSAIGGGIGEVEDEAVKSKAKQIRCVNKVTQTEL